MPQAFQNWCRWYLKKTFGPNRAPRFRPDKSKVEPESKKTQDSKKKEKKKDKEQAEKDEAKAEAEANAWKKEWKIMRKQIRVSFLN